MVNNITSDIRLVLFCTFPRHLSKDDQTYIFSLLKDRKQTTTEYFKKCLLLHFAKHNVSETHITDALVIKGPSNWCWCLRPIGQQELQATM